MKPVKIEYLTKDVTRAGLSGVSGGLDGVGKDAEAAMRKIRKLEAAIAKMMAGESKVLSRGAGEVGASRNSPTSPQGGLSDIEPGTERAAQAVKTLDGVVRQIVRELPALATEPQKFFLAILDHLPVFTNQLAAARKQYEALTAAGMKATPVWKQVLSSIVSWQTAMAVGIMLSVTYGKEIGEWVKGLFSAKKAFDVAKLAAEGFHSVMAKGCVEAQKEITQLNLLYRVATDAKRSYEERRNAVQKLQEIYPAYFGNLSTEQIMVGGALDKYNDLRAAILATAEARAAADAVTENQKQLTLLRQTGDAYDRYRKALTDVADAKKKYKAADKQFVTSPTTGGRIETTPELIALGSAEEQARRARKEFEKELLKLSGGEELWDRIKDRFDSNINDFEEYVRIQNERLLPSAEQIAAGQTVDAKNKAVEAGRKSAEAAAKERAQRAAALAAAIKRLELDAQQAEVDAMAEGTAKKIAQIELDYRKRAQAIEEGEAELRRLRGGKLTSEDDTRLASLRTANEAQRQTERQEVGGGKTLTPEQLSRDFAEEERAWEEYLAEYGTFRERLLATKERYDRWMAEARTEAETAQIARERDAALASFEVEASEWASEILTLSEGRLEKLISETQAKLREAQQAFDALAVSDTTEAEGYRRTIDQLNAQIKVLRKQLAAAKDDAAQGNWSQTATAFQEIASGLRSAADECGAFDEGLADVVNRAADVTAGVGTLIAAIHGIGAAVSSVEKASAILTAISVAIQIASVIFSLLGNTESAVERTRREFAELNTELVRLKREAAIDSWEGTIFSADPYRNATENAKVYIDALRRYNDTIEALRERGEEVSLSKPTLGDFVSGSAASYMGAADKANLYKFEKTWKSPEESIANMQVQTQHSTWFRDAKYQSLGSLLPELFDATGALDMKALKEFQGNDLYNKLTAENRALIDDLIADWELYEDALTEVKDYLSGIFGDLGSTLTDALVDAFANGTDAAEAFRQSVGTALQQMAKQMIYSVTLAPIFEKAQKEMLDVMNDAEMSEEEKFDKYAEILGSMTDDALAQQDRVNALLSNVEEAADRNGLSIKGDESTTQTGQAGAIQTVMQDSAARIEGLVTSIQIHAANMDERFESSTEILSQSFMQLQIITDNTNALPQIHRLLQQLRHDLTKLY